MLIDSQGQDLEIARLCQVYKQRDVDMPILDWKKNIYHFRHPVGQLLHEHDHEVLVTALNSLDINLEALDILDVGCGYGYWLRYLVELGAAPEKMIGVDLSRQRLELAARRNPAIKWMPNDGKSLAFASESFDLAMQVLVFSSIVDDKLRRSLADEMSRVTKEGGYILWVDLKEKHSSDLIGFSKSMAKEYFPYFSIEYAELIQPRYFRRLNGSFAWLARSIYRFTKVDCDSWLLVLRKQGGHS